MNLLPHRFVDCFFFDLTDLISPASQGQTVITSESLYSRKTISVAELNWSTVSFFCISPTLSLFTLHNHYKLSNVALVY